MRALLLFPPLLFGCPSSHLPRWPTRRRPTRRSPGLVRSQRRRPSRRRPAGPASPRAGPRCCSGTRCRAMCRAVSCPRVCRRLTRRGGSLAACSCAATRTCRAADQRRSRSQRRGCRPSSPAAACQEPAPRRTCTRPTMSARASAVRTATRLDGAATAWVWRQAPYRTGVCVCVW